MGMMEWAEKEIEIACKHERGDAPEDEWDYGVACYESALKAYKSLMDDGHSGMSIRFTKNILDRLIDGKPLTPIEDKEEEWNRLNYEKETAEYQAKRMSSLFKTVFPDGSVTFSDVNRIVCVDINNQGITYHSGLVSREINKRYPLQMPYYPPAYPYYVYCEDFLYDMQNGDYDTVGIFYVITPELEKVPINLFFKENPEGEGWLEITEEEYECRKKDVIYSI